MVNGKTVKVNLNIDQVSMWGRVRVFRAINIHNN